MLRKLNILILLLLIVTSCKSSKTHCDAYGSNVILILIDTVTFETEHINWNSQCSESIIITEIYIDTVKLKL